MNDDALQKGLLWLSYAEEDIRTAQIILADAEPSYRNAAYLSQQCAEKAIKAYLVCNRIDFPHTHTISLLLEYVAEVPNFALEFDTVSLFEPYAVAIRYPSEIEPVTREEAQKVFELAKTILRSISELIC